VPWRSCRGSGVRRQPSPLMRLAERAAQHRVDLADRPGAQTLRGVTRRSTRRDGTATTG
jgi:hypothetical protein